MSVVRHTIKGKGRFNGIHRAVGASAKEDFNLSLVPQYAICLVTWLSSSLANCLGKDNPYYCVSMGIGYGE